ncbi:MAG: transporter substrate-binding domain-containing protein [Oscillospiraceae bacterium]|nr:transporter substrate-binding domain-containing protein [Oscillospiraceae bacterium]
MKKEFKKLIALLLSIMMVFTLVSCGKPSEDPTPEPAPSPEPDGGDEPVKEEWVWEGPKYEAIAANPGKAVNFTLPDAPTGVLAKVLDSGKLVIGTSPDYPAAEFVDPITGEIKGNEMLLAKYIANSLGVELVIEAMDFSGVLIAVDTGKVDLGVSGFGWKADRAELYELSAGYSATSDNKGHHTIVVRASDLDKYNSLADFSGKVIDAQASSLQQMYVEDQIPDANLQLITSLDQGILDLLANKVDAIALDSTTAKNYAENSNGQIVSLYVEKKIEFDLSIYDDFSGNVMAAKKGETQFIGVINEILAELLSTENYYEDKGLYACYYYASCDEAGILPDDEEE